MAKRPAKSETLTIRLDPKTRFMLEFVSRLRGQTITTVVERAISESANRATFPITHFDDTTSDRSWKDYWSVSEGERALRLARTDELHPSFEEEKRYAFAKEHWPFFWASADRMRFLNHYIDVLWPKIDEYVALHDTSKATDYFAAGRAMQKALENAGLECPVWPPAPKPAKPTGGYARALDDEIPF